MINLAGLSATYPGFQAAEEQTAKTAVNQTRQRDAAIKLLGANVAGAALAGQQGPQAPPPGQPSVPMKPPLQPQAAPAMPQGAPLAPVAPAAPMAGPPQSKMGLGPAVEQILRTAPGVRNHPEILLSALTHLNDLRLLDPEAQAKVAEASKMHTTGRIAAAKEHLKTVTETPAFPAGGATPLAASPPAITATDPKTGAQVQWDGKTWQPMVK